MNYQTKIDIMKKKITITLLATVCLALFTVLSANAQFSGGVRAGTNLATLNGTFDGYHKVFPRIYGGIFANYKTSDAFALQLELSYTGAGDKLSASSSDATITERLKANYLAVPLLAQYRFPFGGFIELGPQLGFLLSAKDEADGTTTDIKENIKSTDFEAVLGIGYELKKTSLAGLGINVRLVRGLTDISKIPSEGGKITNRGLNIGLTYRFGQHK
ncbi:hypothetical protein MuYL_2257 [Mucilaginibacter xinganensis]|uniref:Outer membrane protein beta-barrel domain-containing protein n=2 Tax=Mucilaginibacter xinganensis TaxID=1234841 RepID=A0A223NWF0_9SPHI|nr:hypothetical protein MuYL_2257 [Mucilaginibacter xinganensis]